MSNMEVFCSVFRIVKFLHDENHYHYLFLTLGLLKYNVFSKDRDQISLLILNKST